MILPMISCVGDLVVQVHVLFQEPPVCGLEDVPVVCECCHSVLVPVLGEAF